MNALVFSFIRQQQADSIYSKYEWLLLTQNSSKQPKSFFTFDVSTSVRGLHRKKLVLSLLLPVFGAIS